MIEWNDEVAMAIENRIDAQVLRIDDIERKQAKRYPLLLERLARLEKKLSTTFKITCKRLDNLEKEIDELLDDTHTHTVYGGTAVPITKDDAEGGSW